MPKQKPVKINNFNIGIIKNNLKGKNNKKKKDFMDSKNTFLKKKKILINTMRYNYSKNKMLSCKNSKNISSNFIINNINNININISNNFADNKNNMIFNYNNFNKSSKIKTPKFINYQKDIIDIKEFGKENIENKNELNISEKVKNSQNKIQAINLDDELKFSI